MLHFRYLRLGSLNSVGRTSSFHSMMTIYEIFQKEKVVNLRPEGRWTMSWIWKSVPAENNITDPGFLREHRSLLFYSNWFYILFLTFHNQRQLRVAVTVPACKKSHEADKLQRAKLISKITLHRRQAIFAINTALHRQWGQNKEEGTVFQNKTKK